MVLLALPPPDHLLIERDRGQFVPSRRRRVMANVGAERLLKTPAEPSPELRIRRVGEDVCHPHPPQTRTCRIPASGSSQESLANGDIAMDDPGPRKRVAGEEGSELLPWEWCRAGPSLQPFPPGPFSLEGILEQLPNVPRDTVVRVVTSQLLRQPLVLLGYWEVAVGPTPFLYCEQRASKSAFGR